jgi:hypothetical protein
LEQWLRYNNPDDPAWAATQDLVSAFAERTKRAIPHVEEVFTDPVKAAAAMEAWEALRIEGTPLDSSTFARFDRQLRDLRPIGQLKGLKKLELGSHGFSDVTPLAGLVQLEKLTLWSNVDFATNKPVPLDLGPLGKLRNLRVLDLSSNEGNLALASLPWENLVNLDELVLSWNEGVDMNALRLQALPKLRKLVIRNAQLKTIEFVAKATTLKVLDLQSNEIRDLSPLKTLTELEELDVMFNPIDGDGVLATLPKLKEIRK